MAAFTPNTTAFLNYLNSQSAGYPFPSDPVQKNGGLDQTSLPPSAFFNMPVPGRDTPEDTPESSNKASESPEEHRSAAVATSSDDEAGPSRRGGRKQSEAAAIHKRKAGHGHTVQEEHHDDDDDSGSDDPNGHEDKRAHPNGKAAAGTASGSGRRGGRKSNTAEDAPKNGKEASKAARRKEQNRAAQKAFRERREAKVKELEDQIAALESKSTGAEKENENLRGILKRLQEENVALKQAAFTFSMPVGAASQTGSRANSMSGTPLLNAQRPKAPTPPADESLRSINDIPGLVPRKSSGMAWADSPDSLISASSGTSSAPSSIQPPTIDSVDAFNAYAAGTQPEWTKAVFGKPGVVPQPDMRSSVSPTNQGTDTVDPFAAFALPNGSNGSFYPTSSASNNNSAELDALWASFYPNGVPASLPQQNIPSAASTVSAAQNSQAATAQQSLGQAGSTFSNGGGSANMFNPLPVGAPAIDKMAFRDQSASFAASAPVQQNGNDWTDLNDDSINDFLASLAGANTAADQSLDPVYDFGQDDNFNSELQKLLEASGGASPGQAFNLSGTALSPTAYLNMSPSPASASASASAPQSQSQSQSPAYITSARAGSGSLSSFSNSASPESLASSDQPTTAASSVYNQPISTAAAVAAAATAIDPVSKAAQTMATAQPKPGEVVHVVDANGKVLKPSDLWVMMGMQHVDTVDNLVIDDLCDQMKSKAVCNDGNGYKIGISDAEHLFKNRIKCPDYP